MPLVGTAGHVDHGKSTLIQALTGRDPDRWDEEKRRGLTIDLGFGWADLGEGNVASFVDVPGHERYLKNMLAGAEAIEIALLVVAANEGWKPQTEEHLAALDLLGVDRAVIALTKTDLVDEELVELVQLEVDEKVSGTGLEGSKVVPVSALTGEGLDRLRDELLILMSRVPPRSGQPRIWIDRVFSLPGAGTVVTGSLLNGRLSVGDEIELYPGGSSRIRTIQSHEENMVSVEPGRRVALGISGFDTSAVGRGTMVGYPAQWSFTDRFSANLRYARYVADLPDRGAYQIHLGTMAQNVTIEAQKDDRAILRLDRPIPAAMGDRFVIRDSGRRLVVAGGRVLDPHPGRRKKAIEQALSLNPELDSDHMASQLLDLRGLDTVANLNQDTGGGRPSEGTEVGGHIIADRKMREFQDLATQLVDTEHARKPLNPGLPLATLATKLGVPAEIAEEVVRRSSLLNLLGPDVSLKTHTPSLPADLASAWEVAKTRLRGDLAVPTTGELGIGVEALHLLIRDGELVRINDDLVYLPQQIEAIVSQVGELSPPFGVAEFKESLGLSRKYAVPILEWLDANHFTLRRGDKRVFGSRLPRNDN